MSTAKRVIKNTGFLYAKMGITMFVSLYTTRLVLNALGASDFGVFSIVGGAIGMLGFLNASMASATQRFMSYAEGEGDKEKQKRIFNISTVLHFFIAIIVGFVLLVGGYFFFNGILNIEPDRVNAAKVIYGSLIISTIFTVMTVPYDAVLNARENMLYYAIVGIIESLLKLGVAIAVVYTTGDKLITYGVLMAVIPLVTMIIMRVYCHRKYEECVISPRMYWDKGLMKEMRGFAGWSLMASVGSMFGFYGQGLLLNAFFGTVLNTAQGIASQLNGQITVFVTNIQKALNPAIVKKEGGGHRKSMLDISLIGTRLSFVVLLFFVVPVVTYMELLLKWWLGNKVFAEMILFSQLTLIRSLIEQLSITLSASISATGNIKKIKMLASMSSISSLLISFVLFKNGFGPSALYYVFIFNTTLIVALVIGDARDKCGLKITTFFKSVLFPCLWIFFFLTGYSIVYKHVMPEDFLSFLVYCIIYLIVFFLGSLKFVLTRNERVSLEKVIKNILIVKK